LDNWFKVDFHCHTIYSHDSLNFIKRLVHNARLQGLDKLVITDHNCIRGALVAKSLDPDLIIIGEEIMTTGGEILAAYVQDEIPRGLRPFDAIERLKKQGAFISLSHPFDSSNRTPWSEKMLSEILPFIDAIEIFNARNIDKTANHKAAHYAQLHQLSGTVGSDAHLLCEIGCASLILPPFDTPEGLRKVIQKGIPQGKLSSHWVHFGSALARLYKLFHPLPVGNG
jgi:predicted metal-dependent phosphoesterase TrpH